MRQFKALDLFCKAGGATKGLQMAGFHVTGVDIEPQPRYCGDAFIQADVMMLGFCEPLGWQVADSFNRHRILGDFDFIWASPPCQAYSIAANTERKAGKVYADLVAAVRNKLEKWGKNWVIENVPGAPIRADLILCGSHFGLQLVRHRLFEFGWPFLSLIASCAHHEDPITVCGNGTPGWVRKKHPGRVYRETEKREAMGIDWMRRAELSQAIPPAYSEYIGKEALKRISED